MNHWPDRHPTAAVVLATVVLIAVTGYPWLLAVAAVAGLAWSLDRERQRRHATAERADRQHAQLMAGLVAVPALPALRCPAIRRRPLSELPTRPLHTRN